jgi:uncharacterized membrane protein
MNIHPIFVHFPLAFLTVYAAFEIVRLPFFTQESWYKPVKKALLYIGTLMSFITLQTGESAEHLMKVRNPLVETHSTWATVSVWIFVVIAVGYLLETCATKTWFARLSFLLPIGKIIRTLAPLLAFVGLVAITVAGALGGAIVYGPDVDPIVKFIYGIVIGA